MAKNKNENNNNNREVVAEEKKDNGGGEQKNEDSNSVTAVYNFHMCCEGCVNKIKRCVEDFQGVEDVKAEMVLNKLTVVGKVDPTMLRDKLSQKTKKDVELISPLPPKKDNKAAADDNKPDKKAEDKKPKENKNESSNNNREAVAEEKKDNGGGQKKNDDSNSFTAVYKIDMHCNACSRKIKRALRGFEGVEDVMVETVQNKETALDKVTVVGKIDPTKVRDRLSQKTKRDVELVSPLPPKKDNKAAADHNKPDKKAEDKKPKETPLKTSIWKMKLHCDGCISKIKKIIRKYDGCEAVTVNARKQLVMVTGTVDVNTFAEYLRDKLKRTVEFVSSKNEIDSGGSRGDVDKKDGNGGGSGSGSGGGKKKGGGDGGQEEGGGGGKNRMDVFGHPAFGYYDHGCGYGNGFVNGYGHANGWEWEWICAWILRTLYLWVDLWVGTCNMHQICSVKKTQMLALSCEEGKIVF